MSLGAPAGACPDLRARDVVALFPSRLLAHDPTLVLRADLVAQIGRGQRDLKSRALTGGVGTEALGKQRRLGADLERELASELARVPGIGGLGAQEDLGHVRARRDPGEDHLDLVVRLRLELIWDLGI